MNLNIRLAHRNDMDWINECYRDAAFIESNFDREMIAIAEIKGEKVGVGRLVKYGDQDLELGGMLVSEPFRKQGIAKKIVLFLLKQVQKGQNVYCIPFANLYNFYHQFGFTLCDSQFKIPQALLDKRAWCRKKYPQEALLMSLKEG